jgi:hypothetical protein
MISLSPALRRYLAGLLLAVPVVFGACYSVVADIDPADSWSDGQQRLGAPAVADSTALVDARRATGEANSQASFLVNGTGQLVDGTEQLSNRSDEVSDAVTGAKDGAKQLSDGMVELQAATGQMGDGATKVADGVQTAVDQVVGFEAARGQIVGTLDRYIADLKNAKDPDSVKLREQLVGFRDQANAFELDGNIKTQLEDLKNGSRELANQLDTPGYAFHDGMYSATKGSKELSDGLNQLDAGVAEALAGVNELEQGAAKVDNMAGLTKDRIGGIQRAMPVTQAGTPEAELAGISRTIAPMYAFLIAAAVLLGAVLRVKDNKWLMALMVVGLAAMASCLTGVLGVGIGVGELAGVAGIAVLTALAGMLSGVVLVRLVGALWGQAIAFVGVLAQIGIVGMAWNQATTHSPDGVWAIISALLPVHYSTSALAALGNSASSTTALGLSAAVLLLTCCAGVLSLKFVGVDNLHSTKEPSSTKETE